MGINIALMFNQIYVLLSCLDEPLPY